MNPHSKSKKIPTHCAFNLRTHVKKFMDVISKILAEVSHRYLCLKSQTADIQIRCYVSCKGLKRYGYYKSYLVFPVRSLIPCKLPLTLKELHWMQKLNILKGNFTTISRFITHLHCISSSLRGSGHIFQKEDSTRKLSLRMESENLFCPRI